MRNLLLATIALLAVGCGDSAVKDGSSNAIDINNSEPQVDCLQECSAKEAQCGIAGGSFACDMTCAQLTNSEALCLSNATCEALFAAETVEDLCGGANNSTINNMANSGNSGNAGNSCPAPTCEGDVLVTCDDSGGFQSTTRTTCSAGCADGACLGAPTEATVSGPADSPEPFRAEDEGVVTSVLTIVSESPTYSPELPDSINVSADGVSMTVVSPSPGGCTPTITRTASRSQISAQITGQDTLPALDCSNFVDDVASNGLTLRLDNVPYLNRSETIELTMEFEVR